MDTECTSDQIPFKPLAGRQVTAEFDGGAITSDAGVLLLREVEEKFGVKEEKFFHGYYGHCCYLPLHVFAGEWLVASLLRFSGQDASADCLNTLHLLVDAIQSRWSDCEILIRGDSGFARERIMSWCEEWDIEYVLGLAQNSRLRARIEEPMAEAERQFEETEQPVREFRKLQYATLDSWSHKRRVIGKVEYIHGEPNPRFVVMSLDRRDVCGKAVYETIYCQRGEVENRIEECQLGLYADQLEVVERQRKVDVVILVWSLIGFTGIRMVKSHIHEITKGGLFPWVGINTAR